MRPAALLLRGDARDLPLRDESVQCVVTSPPYWGLRSYGDEVVCEWPDGYRGQLGLEPTPDLYVAHLVEIFREVWRVLRKDGTVWLNMGDCYATGAGRVGERPGGGSQGDGWQGPVTQPNRMPLPGLKAKDLVMMPARVAMALQADGWWLRSDVVWAKCLGHSVRVYARTQKGEMPMTVGEMCRLKPETVALWAGDRRVQAESFKPIRSQGFEIEFRNGLRIPCTADHRWPVRGIGLVLTSSLLPGMVVEATTLPEPAQSNIPGCPDAVGYVAGLYLAEGSRLASREGLQFSLSTHDETATKRLVELAFYGESVSVHDYGKERHANLHGGLAAAAVLKFVNGNGSKRKHLSSIAWRRSNGFLHEVLMGYLEGDGHLEPDGEWRLGFTRNDALADDLRTICARLGYSVRLWRTWHGNQTGKKFYGFRGSLRMDGSRRTSDWEIRAVRRAKGTRFYEVAVGAPHIFALASGVMTHNSNPMPESVTDRPTKAHEFVFLLTKSATYFYDAEAVKEPLQSSSILRLQQRTCDSQTGGPKDYQHGTNDNRSARRALVNLKGRMMPPQVGDSPEQWAALNGRNLRSVWTIATQPFLPSKLVEICVKAGTSERGACATCGAPWERTIDTVYRNDTTTDGRPAQGNNVKGGEEQGAKTFASGVRTRRIDTTTGWRSTCGCGCDETAPSIVLDPFSGSGTVPMVAQELGRVGIGVELKPDYLAMAQRRTAQGVLI